MERRERGVWKTHTHTAPSYSLLLTPTTRTFFGPFGLSLQPMMILNFLICSRATEASDVAWLGHLESPPSFSPAADSFFCASLSWMASSTRFCLSILFTRLCISAAKGRLGLGMERPVIKGKAGGGVSHASSRLDSYERHHRKCDK